jgi:hypothetical protein
MLGDGSSTHDLLVVAGGTSQERTHSAVAVIGAVLDNVTRRN